MIMCGWGAPRARTGIASMRRVPSVPKLARANANEAACPRKQG
jgi:hypothetical protein